MIQELIEKYGVFVLVVAYLLINIYLETLKFAIFGNIYWIFTKQFQIKHTHLISHIL